MDCQIYGMNAGRHHLTSLLFHIANTLLIFVVLKRMTRALWRSAFVAALFALHPLHVQSVAWVAERKDVLSTFFWLLTMWTYVRYVECPRVSRYFLILLSFAFGLMSKPMLVTLPFVLLLLDYWPLDRVQMGRSTDVGMPQTHKSKTTGDQKAIVFRLVWEKTPLFALSAASSVVTAFSQHSAGATWSWDVLPLKIRIANALFSYVRYVEKMIWPQGLAVLYPYPADVFATWKVAGAAFLLVCILVLSVRAARGYPYLAVGWLWYLGTLVPVIGLVQVGPQSMADRYTYVPLIGLFIIIGWGFDEVVARWRYRRIASGAFIGVLLLALIICSRMQVRYWRNSASLFQHAIDVTTNNYYAQHSLGKALARQGKLDEAIVHYSKALQIRPDYAEAYFCLGAALEEQRKFQEAISSYSKALQIRPNYAPAHNNLGILLGRKGNLEEAIGHFLKVLEARPDYAEAHNNLGITLARQGKLDEAIRHLSEAVRIKPDYAEASNNLRVLRQARKPQTVSTTPTGQ